MRHQKKKFILSRKKPARQALHSSQIRNLVRAKKIMTTEAKAKALRPNIEKLITLAKKDNLSNRRRAKSILKSDSLVKILFEEIAPKFKDRPGGYTRIIKTGFRQGDGAPCATIELILS